MNKIICVLACAALTMVACGKPKPPTNPSMEPSTPEGEESTAPEPAASDPAGTASPDKPASEPSTPAATPAAVKQACSALPKTTCKITQGCAWYEQGGKGKCIDEEEQ